MIAEARRITTCLAVLVAAFALAGCGGKQDKLSLKRLFGPSPKESVAMMFDPDDADRRRQGVVNLSRKDWGLREPYLKGYAMLLRTDADPSVRCVSARALGLAGDEKYLPDLVAALKDESDAVRWDAAVAMDGVTGPKAVEPLRRSALGDVSADVRRSCLRALRHYRRQDVLETLIAGLSDGDFSVRFEAHRSLVGLTGRDLGHEPGPWADATGAELLRKPEPDEDPNPWWDWAGVTKKRSSPPPPATTQPAEESR